MTKYQRRTFSKKSVNQNQEKTIVDYSITDYSYLMSTSQTDAMKREIEMLIIFTLYIFNIYNVTFLLADFHLPPKKL